MNRRGFLTQLLKGTVAAIAAPQIVTHGLQLVKQNGIWIWTPEDLYQRLPYYLVKTKILRLTCDDAHIFDNLIQSLDKPISSMIWTPDLD